MVTVISASPAGPAGAGHALPFQPDGLAVGEAGRNLDLDLLAGRQMHAPRRAGCNLRQRDGDRAGDVAALGRSAEFLRLELRTPAGAAGRAAEHVLEDIVDAAAEAAAPAPRAAAALEAVRAPGEVLEAAVLAESLTEAARPRPPPPPGSPGSAACLRRRSRRGRTPCACHRRPGFRRPRSARRTWSPPCCRVLLASGCSFLARRRNALLIAAGLAFFCTPRTS